VTLARQCSASAVHDPELPPSFAHLAASSIELTELFARGVASQCIMPTMTDLKNMTPQEIERFLRLTNLANGAARGCAQAIQLYRKRRESFDAMTDLNRPFRELLASRCTITTLAAERSETADDGTVKLLYRLTDGNTVEGVLIPDRAALPSASRRRSVAPRAADSA